MPRPSLTPRFSYSPPYRPHPRQAACTAIRTACCTACTIPYCTVPRRYNATLTSQLEGGGGGVGRGGGGGGPKRHTEALKALAKVNPRVLAAIQELCQVRVCDFDGFLMGCGVFVV